MDPHHGLASVSTMHSLAITKRGQHQLFLEWESDSDACLHHPRHWQRWQGYLTAAVHPGTSQVPFLFQVACVMWCWTVGLLDSKSMSLAGYILLILAFGLRKPVPLCKINANYQVLLPSS